MALPSGPMHMDRTAELYAKLNESPEGEARMILDMFDFVFAPVTLGKKSRKVYGPADVLVLKSDVVVMHVIFTGRQPEQKVYEPERMVNRVTEPTRLSGLLPLTVGDVLRFKRERGR